MTTLLGSYAPHWDRYSDHQCSRHKTLSRLTLSPSYFNIRSIIIFLRVKSLWAVLVCLPISCICVSVILGRPDMADLSPHRVKQSNSETKLFWFPLHPPYTNNLQRRWKKIAGIRQAELEQTIFLWSYLEWVVIISEFFAITSSRVMRQWTHEIFWNKHKSYIWIAACKMKRATIPSVRDMDFPILKVWTLEVWALKTHLLFGLALHSPAGVQCQHWES